MKIVFFGTPDYAVFILDTISKKLRYGNESVIAAVITQTPKPTGRKKIISYSPVDKWAHKRKIPTFYSSEDFLKSGIVSDLGILASYGEIIPKQVLNSFKYGVLNIHPSLLPKYRGSSPIQAAIVNGDQETGVSIIKLDEKLDHGPLVNQFKEIILNSDDTQSLRSRLFERGAQVLLTLIPSYISGKIKVRKQDDKASSLTKQLTKDDGFIPPKYISNSLKGVFFKEKWEIKFCNSRFTPGPLVIERFIRAMKPWPIAWTYIFVSDDIKKEKKRLKILKAHICEKASTKGKSKTFLVLDSVQLEGKGEVSWDQFVQGHPKYSF